MLQVKLLSSGYYLIRGKGLCNWSQPPEWPTSEDKLREYAFSQASEEFIREATKEAEEKNKM